MLWDLEIVSRNFELSSVRKEPTISCHDRYDMLGLLISADCNTNFQLDGFLVNIFLFFSSLKKELVMANQNRLRNEIVWYG
jgi:hypothetical protein